MRASQVIRFKQHCILFVFLGYKVNGAGRHARLTGHYDRFSNGK